MLRSLYSGISGMRGFQLKLDVIGNNIANVNTVGFKASRVMFRDILSQTIAGASGPTDQGVGGVNAKQVGLGSTIAAIDTLHTQGSAMTTNVATDLRIDGDGFFAVAPSQDAEQRYLTRAGNFTVDAAGFLVNPEGMYVLDEGGDPINITGLGITAFTIAPDGQIIGVGADGVQTATGVYIGVVTVTNPGGLEKIGGNLYRLTPNASTETDVTALIGRAADPERGSGAIVSGQLEMSNVDLTNEFTEMIVAQRGFQANSRIITTSDSILEEIVNLKR
ncbi:MAG: flagellar basal body rod protein FlgG [Candidatus Reconcilbacillus cellulovorans]|mgnify:CR=1 FL=1|uniref:Flagellar hook protein FlgE n=1 Tax=Candidatus Reconcilbacillus cellulovorans TaxID=1906605 RepID=A0A2A6E2N4_9BACL|nr:MAG: flagellar basal body rod protein FlgG [Candidatus Reconcilbacillus cellulovorans]